MADDTTRIINLTEATEISDGMYLVTDASTGTRKLSLQKVLDKSGGNVADEYDSTATYDVGDLVVYKGVLYECSTEISTAEAWNPDHWSRINLGDIIADMDGAIDDLEENKADTNGNYPDLTAGNANQLLSNTHLLDSVPYNFRTAGGSLDIGDREELEIVGVSVGWNQLASYDPNANGATINSHTDNSMNVTLQEYSGSWLTPFFKKQNVVSNKIPFIVGHKYLYTGDIQLSESKTGRLFYVLGGTSSQASTWFNVTNPTTQKYRTATIVSCVTAMDSAGIFLQAEFGSVTIDLQNINVTDLTLCFGPTIADYVYSLEQATAGSGVAWLKHYFPKMFGGEYHAYDAGSIQSVSGLSAHVMRGFNAYNHADGTAKVVGGNEYEVVGTYTSLSLDGQTITPVDGKFTPTISGTLTVTGGADNTCIHLVWDGERDGQYEPYISHSYALDDSITLRGMLKLDSNNVPYADGDVYHPDGTIDDRFGEVDLGDLTWVKGNRNNDNTGNIFYCQLSQFADTPKAYSDFVSSKFVNYGASVSISWEILGKGHAQLLAAQIIACDEYPDAASFKTAMSGVKLVYEKATPETLSATPYSSPQICNNWGTEEFVSTSLVPVGHNTKYPPDLKAKLEMLPSSPDGDGDYIVRQSGGENAFVALTKELPPVPSEDGTYALKVTVSGGVATKSWESES